MDRQSLVKKILNKKGIRDYTYATLFLFTSSFFTFFVIRPALSVAFSLKKEASELRRISDQYEKNILRIIKIQSQLEMVRNDLYLIDEAIPNKSKMKKLVDEIKNVASSEGIIIKDLNFSKINLKKTKQGKTINSLKINIAIEADFPKVLNFTEKIIKSRRLMEISKLEIIKENVSSTESAELKVETEIQGFYL